MGHGGRKVRIGGIGPQLWLMFGRCWKANMTNLVSRRRGERVPQPLARDVSGVRGLLDRKDLLLLLDRAVTKRLTVISAPPGSGKTSLLRTWADHSTEPRRVAVVSV